MPRIVIDSAQRDTASGVNPDPPSDYRFQLRLPVKGFTSVVLEQVILPDVIYNVNVKNETFDATGSVSGLQTVTIARGGYTGASLASALQTALRAVFSGNETVSYDSDTSKLTITSPSETISAGSSVPLLVTKLLGFAPGLGQTIGTSGGTEQIFPIDLSYPRYILLNLDFLQSADAVTTNVGEFQFVVPLIADDGFGSFIDYTVGNNFVQRTGLQFAQIDRIKVAWFWPDGTSLTEQGTNNYAESAFNNIDHQIILRID